MRRIQWHGRQRLFCRILHFVQDDNPGCGEDLKHVLVFDIDPNVFVSPSFVYFVGQSIERLRLGHVFKMPRVAAGTSYREPQFPVRGPSPKPMAAITLIESRGFRISDILSGYQPNKTNPHYLMHLLMTVSLIVVEIMLVVVLADFLAGVIHWAEDAYFSEETPVIGPLFIRPNIVHHHFPRFFTRLSWWQSSWDLTLIGGAILLIAWPLGLLCWQLGFFVALSINANEVHKWSHRTRTENGWLISKLQEWHVLQTPRHHGLHHSDPKNTYYCPITNLVNPMLELVHFWDRAETVVERLTGATHRPDTAVRGKGPGPEWLSAYRPVPKQPCATPCSSCLKQSGHRPCPKAALVATRVKSSSNNSLLLSGLIRETS